MHISIDLPDDLVARLQEHWGDLSGRALEAVAVAAYRDGILSAADVGRLLGHTSRWETERFLNDRRAFLEYSEDDADRDTDALRHIGG